VLQRRVPGTSQRVAASVSCNSCSVLQHAVACVLQSRVPSTSQRVAASVCDEETAQKQSGTSQSGGPGLRRTRHPHVHRQSLRCQLLLQLRDKGQDFTFHGFFSVQFYIKVQF